jgi:hypothetical protein
VRKKKKRAVFIAPPSYAAPIASPRLKRSTAPKLPTRAKTKGAFGKRRASTAKRLLDHAASSLQANELTQAKRLERAYKEFYATPQGKKFAKEFGKSYSDSSPRRTGGGDCDPQFCDPADLPAASVLDHPVDHIEPESDSVEISGLSEAEIKTASELFSDVLRWGLGCDTVQRPFKIVQAGHLDSPLVQRGKRSIVLIAFMRPDLAADKIDKTLSSSFLVQFGDKLSELEAAGLLFGRYLEWMRRSNTFSAYGERLDITAYMLRPDLLPASTLAKLGEILNKSRQAKDKLANCARDTFAGLKAPPMRNDITRARCRASQLQNL